MGTSSVRFKVSTELPIRVQSIGAKFHYLNTHVFEINKREIMSENTQPVQLVEVTASQKWSQSVVIPGQTAGVYPSEQRVCIAIQYIYLIWSFQFQIKAL